MLRFLVVAVPALMLAWPASAQPVLDANALPGASAAARESYAGFLAANLPRAFALGANGAFGWQGGAGTPEAVRARALERCAARGPNCAIYAENLDVVWDGRAPQPQVTPGPFVSTWNYSVVPDNRYIWRGPAEAAGVYVWAHGTGPTDARGLQPQAHVRAFNNVGFDVVRFDRDPTADSRPDARERAGEWLAEGAAELRRRGYRRVVAGGQSRGGWNSLQLLSRPGLADAVIAVSPAAHGSGSNVTAQNDDLRRLVASVPASQTRVAFVQFQNDPYVGDYASRRELVERLRGRVGALLVLDQPEGFTGHGAGATALFATRYGPCLLRFATAPAAPPSC